MALDWKALVSFGGRDEISGAVDKARKTTEKAGKGMGDSLSDTGRKADDLKSKIGGIADIAKGVAIGNLITKGITAAISGMKNLITSVNEFASRADAAGKEASKIGLSAEGFQKLAYAASQSNVPTEKLSSAFNVLNKNLGQFQLGSGNLYKYLSENNKGLYDQVKAAKSNTEVFNVLADAVANETDIAKRSALGNAALGKSWAELYPLLAQGAEGIKAAGEAIPDLITNRQVAMATAWNSTWTEIKRSIQGFCDIIRSAVVQYVGPYVLAIKDLIASSRELIKQKIEAAVQKAVIVFKKAVGIIQELIKHVSKAIDFFKEWGPIILTVGATVGVLWGIVSATIAIKNAITMVKSAFAILNAVMSANPIAIIIIGVAALIAGFVVLMDKVGGFKNALVVAGQTIMKVLLTPINLVIDAVGGLLSAIGKIPGMNWAKTGADSIQSFQDKMNTLLTGGTSTIYGGAIAGAVAGFEKEGIAGAIKGGAGGVASVVTESYDTHRAAYLEAHPDEAPGMKPAADNADDNWEKMISKFDEMIKAQGATTGAVLDLQDSGPNSPANLRWNKMGAEDFFETQRQGL